VTDADRPRGQFVLRVTASSPRLTLSDIVAAFVPLRRIEPRMKRASGSWDAGLTRRRSRAGRPLTAITRAETIARVVMVAEALADLKAKRAPTMRRAFLDQIEAAQSGPLIKRRIAKRRELAGWLRDGPKLVLKDLERTARHLRRFNRIVAGQSVVPALAVGAGGRRMHHENVADHLAWLAGQSRLGVVWRVPMIERSGRGQFNVLLEHGDKPDMSDAEPVPADQITLKSLR
jgi:hypothetical protein